MKKTTLIGIILVSLLLIGGIFSLIFFLPQKKLAPEKETLPVQKITPPKVIYNLAGIVQKKEINSIIFEANIPLTDETGRYTSKKEIRKAIITSYTKFTQLSFVEVEPGKKTPTEKQISFKDIKVGDYIEVISKQDISHVEEFEATQIRVLPK